MITKSLDQQSINSSLLKITRNSNLSVAEISTAGMVALSEEVQNIARHLNNYCNFLNDYFFDCSPVSSIEVDFSGTWQFDIAPRKSQIIKQLNIRELNMVFYRVEFFLDSSYSNYLSTTTKGANLITQWTNSVNYDWASKDAEIAIKYSAKAAELTELAGLTTEELQEVYEENEEAASETVEEEQERIVERVIEEAVKEPEKKDPVIPSTVQAPKGRTRVDELIEKTAEKAARAKEAQDKLAEKQREAEKKAADAKAKKADEEQIEKDRDAAYQALDAIKSPADHKGETITYRTPDGTLVTVSVSSDGNTTTTARQHTDEDGNKITSVYTTTKGQSGTGLVTSEGYAHQTTVDRPDGTTEVTVDAGSVTHVGPFDYGWVEHDGERETGLGKAGEAQEGLTEAQDTQRGATQADTDDLDEARLTAADETARAEQEAAEAESGLAEAEEEVNSNPPPSEPTTEDTVEAAKEDAQEMFDAWASDSGISDQGELDARNEAFVDAYAETIANGGTTEEATEAGNNAAAQAAEDYHNQDNEEEGGEGNEGAS